MMIALMSVAKDEYEYNKKLDSWGDDLHINIFCIIFKIDIAVFNERNKIYKIFFIS